MSRKFAKGLLFLATAFFVVYFPIAGNAADAEEMSAVEEMLEILREMNAVDQAKYEELKRKLAAEKEEARIEDEEVVSPDNPLHATWKDGPRFATEDGNFEFNLSGRVHLHSGYISSNDDIEDAFENDDADYFRTFFRRARLGVAGKIYQRLGFKAEYDFAGGDVDFADVFLQAYDVPFAGTVTIGHFKEPISLDEMTSTNNNWFVERSQVNEAFYQSREVGIRFVNLVEGRLGYALAVMSDTDSSGNGPFSDSNTRLVGRVWGLPLSSEETGVMHLGLSYRHLFLSDNDESANTQRYRSRPETQVTDLRFVDTGTLTTDDTDLIIGEFAWARNRWNVVAEYFHQMVDLEEGDNPTFWGAYGLASYFLTDDSRSYNARLGGFGGVRPNHPFTEDGGWGAWEIAGRYSYLNLDDEDVDGGTQGIFTAGLNWYPAALVRFMLNYSFVTASDRNVGGVELDEETVHVIQSRFQLDF